MSDFSTDTLRCMRAGVPYVLADAENDPRVLPEQRAIYHRTGIVAVICVPLHKAGRFVAAMAVHQASPREWTAAEVALLETVVGRCWESLQRAHAIGAVRESEQRFRMLVERASDAIWLVDDSLHYIDANPAACALLGYTREEHLALVAADVIRPEDAPRLGLLVDRLLAGESVTDVWQLRRRDGSTVPVELSMRSATRGRLQAIGRDISERLRAEAERERLLRREQETNRQLDLLQQATAALSAAATPAEVAATTAPQLDQLRGTRSVAVWERRGGGHLQPLAVAGTPPAGALAAAESAAGTGTPLWLPDDDGALLCLPLLTGQGCLGVVAVGLPAARVLDATERATAEALADQCAQALHRAGLLEAERVARRAAEEIGEVVAALSGATSTTQVADVVLDHAAALGVRSAVVVLRTGSVLEPVAARGTAEPPAARDLDAPDPLATAVRTGTPRWDGDPVAVPLLLSGRAIGAIGLWFAEDAVGIPADQHATVLTVAEQCAQAMDRARLHQAEHEVADVLQRSLLPRQLPALARVAAAAHYAPATEHALSGGDWYDMLPLDDSRVALVVGDVVGHGPAAAAVMGQLRSALAAHLLDGRSPAAALERLDRFAAGIDGAAGSTCACLVYDWSTGELRWALAGHPPVLLVDNRGTRFLDTGAGSVLGVRSRPPYREATTTVAPGASVVLYTDGLVERRDEVLDAGLARLAEVAAGLADHGPDDLARALARGALPDGGPPDDVALLVVRAVPAPLHGRLPAVATSMSRLRHTVSAWAVDAGLPEIAVEDLELAVGEAAANAAEHAYPDEAGDVEYALARTPEGAVDVRVRDHGRWRPVRADNGHRGHGLRVIGRLTEDFVVDRGDDGTEVRFRLPVSRSEPGPEPRRPGRRATLPRPPAPVGVERHDTPGGSVLAVHGDLDLAGRDVVGPALLAAARERGRGALVVDLTDVGYLSSAGVALLAQASAAGSLSIVVAPGSAPARVLRLTGLASALPVRDADSGY
jgi:anti-anti-sigma factor